MAENRGKKFENVIRESFMKVPNTSVVRLPDPVMGYLGYRNICDFIVYKYPYQYFIECKSVHGNTLPLKNITDNQWKGLAEMSKIYGVRAGVICWYIDKDETVYYPIIYLLYLKSTGAKSCHCGIWDESLGCFKLQGKKKRVFFDYSMQQFFEAFA